jgi:hypothetical protein
MIDLSKDNEKSLTFKEYSKSNINDLQAVGKAAPYFNNRISFYEGLKAKESTRMLFKHFLPRMVRNIGAKKLKFLTGEKYQTAKKRLTAVTISAEFGKSRKIINIKKYTNMLQIDIDKITPPQVKEARKILMQAPFILVIFDSVGVNGIKGIAALDQSVTKEQHLSYFKYIEQYFSEKGINIDKSTKDLTRLCFVPYSEKIYVNQTLEPLCIEPSVLSKYEQKTDPLEKYKNAVPKTDPPQKASTRQLKGHITVESPCNEKLAFCARITDNNVLFIEGQKNEHACHFALFANRMAVPMQTAETYYYANYDKETCNAFDSEYKNTAHWNTFEYQPYTPPKAVPKVSQASDPLPLPTPQKKLTHTPFPLHLLPNVVQDYCKALKQSNGHHIEYTAAAFLTAAAAAIGNSHTVSYNSDWIEPCLLFMCLVGKSSTMKSPSLRTMLAPIRDYETELTE